MNRPRADVIVGLQRKDIAVLRVMGLFSQIIVVDDKHRECSAGGALTKPIHFSFTASILASDIGVWNLLWPHRRNVWEHSRLFAVSSPHSLGANPVINENPHISGSKWRPIRVSNLYH